jgi:hypothetical protein
MQIESKKHLEIIRNAMFEYIDPDSPFACLRNEERLQTAAEIIQAIDIELKKIEG